MKVGVWGFDGTSADISIYDEAASDCPSSVYANQKLTLCWQTMMQVIVIVQRVEQKLC